jgi:hypothetical protein
MFKIPAQCSANCAALSGRRPSRRRRHDRRSDVRPDRQGSRAQLYTRIQAGEKLPGTDLMKIVAAYFKAKEEALKQQAVEDKVYTLTDLIADVNLPPERKKNCSARSTPS